MEYLYKDLKNQLSKNGINIINTEYYSIIDTWKSWYKGNVENFHKYNVTLYDGTTTSCEMKTMSMAKKLCEDMTKLLWSDKCNISIGSDKKTKQLWNILDSKKNNFSIMLPRLIEYGCALGTSAMVEYKDETGDTRIEYITDAMNIIPYKYDNFNITGFVAINQWTESENNKVVYYNHLTYHEFSPIKNEDGIYSYQYIKMNELYKSTDSISLGKPIDFAIKFPNVKEIVVYDTDTPHFQIFRPNIANNLDITTPMGISMFANSIDRLKSLDTKYDSFYNEFIDGRKKILVDATALKGTPQVDSNGNVTSQLYYDRNDRTFIAMRGMEKQPIKEIDFNLRYQEHINGINADLNWLSSNVGFGENFYKFDGASVKTATEVKSEDSDAYRTKSTYTIVLRDNIIDLIKSICFLSGINVEEKDIQIDFDYSRFKDDTAEQNRIMNEVNKGITSKYEYRMKIYGETEEEAKEKIAEIKADSPTINDLVGGN